MAKKILFQKWRIFIWTMRQAVAGGKYAKSDTARAEAYRHLVELGEQAFLAAKEGKQDMFLAKLDLLDAQGSMPSLDELLKQASTFEGIDDSEVPDWLRKDK